MLQEIQRGIEKALTVFDNPVVYVVFVMFAGLYATILAPRVTAGVKRYFDMPAFKVVFFTLVILLSSKDPRLALILGLVFVFTAQSLSKLNLETRLRHVFRVPAAQKDIGAPASSEMAQPAIDANPTFEPTGETQIALPLHDDLIHAGPQSMGEPIQGYEDNEGLVGAAFS